MSHRLADCNPVIRSSWFDTARDLITFFGGKTESLSFLVPILESVLESGQISKYTNLYFSMEKILKSAEASNFPKEGVVTSLGRVVFHFLTSSLEDEHQTKIMDILSILHKSLHAHSEEVKHSSTLCSSKLVSKMKNKEMCRSRVEQLIANTLNDSL